MEEAAEVESSVWEKKLTDPQSQHQADETERVFVSKRWQTKIAIYYFGASLILIAGVLGLFSPSVAWLPHPLVAIVFSLPLIGLGALYSTLQKLDRLIISSASLKWRSCEIFWQDIKSITESNRDYLSLEIETSTKRVSLPIAGTKHLAELRLHLNTKANRGGLSLPIRSSGWQVCLKQITSLGMDTLIGLTVIHLVRYSSPLVIPQEQFLLPGITYLAFSAVAGTAFKMEGSRAFLLENFSLDESLIQSRDVLTKKTSIAFSTITSLEASAPDPYYGEGLLIKAGTHQILLDSHFPNYPQVVKEICRRTGLKVQDA